MSASASRATSDVAQMQRSRSDERSGLNKVMWFGILQLGGIAAGWSIGFYVFSTLFTTPESLNLPPNPTPHQVSAALGPLFQAITLILPLVLAIQLTALVVLTLGFRDLSRVDRGNFSLPSTLMFVLIAGVAVGAAGAFLLLGGIPGLIAQASLASNGTPSQAFLNAMSSLLFAFLMIGVGGTLGLVGIIGGQILGLWRVGSRYNEIVIKLGAVFAVVPLLNIVAPVLVLAGAYQARNRLGPL